jgi:hypothetical protein
MSQRMLSWVLTLTAFCLFALACTLGRRVVDVDRCPPGARAADKRPTANQKNKPSQTANDGAPPSRSALAECGMEDFYRKNPSLRGHMSSVLESAVRVKLINHLDFQIQNAPRDIPRDIRRCLNEKSAPRATLADARR